MWPQYEFGKFQLIQIYILSLFAPFVNDSYLLKEYDYQIESTYFQYALYIAISLIMKGLHSSDFN